ncbi:MAG: hypothetical protein Q9183_006461, partial [Haloplaca sp. 2 TL-2023]
MTLQAPASQPIESTASSQHLDATHDTPPAQDTVLDPDEVLRRLPGELPAELFNNIFTL